MKKLIVALFCGLSFPIVAMDDIPHIPKYKDKRNEIGHALNDEDFHELIRATAGNIAELSNTLIEEKSTYAILLNIIKSHSMYHDFDPRVQDIIQGHNISYFSKLGYNTKTKKSITLNSEQEQIFVALQKMVTEKHAYHHTNQLLLNILETIKEEEEKEEAPTEKGFCAIL